MSLIFKLKLKLSKSSLLDKFILSENVFNADGVISQHIADFEHDYEKVMDLRLNTRNTILRLERAMERVSSVELSRYEKNCLKDYGYTKKP